MVYDSSKTFIVTFSVLAIAKQLERIKILWSTLFTQPSENAPVTQEPCSVGDTDSCACNFREVRWAGSVPCQPLQGKLDQRCWGKKNNPPWQVVCMFFSRLLRVEWRVTRQADVTWTRGPGGLVCSAWEASPSKGNQQSWNGELWKTFAKESFPPDSC